MKVFSVSEITGHIKLLLKSEPLLSDVWISGEVTNASKVRGNTYFTLRDETNQIQCVKFQDNQSHILSDGALVLLHGRIDIYEIRGSVQCYVDMVQEQGLGEQQLEFEKLKLKLESEGLFEESRKRLIPSFPKNLLAITSATGAVWQDIQNVVTRRYPLVELTLIQCQVQGDYAVPSILHAFEAVKLIENVDTIILARGGGSADDLKAFNDESLVRAIYSCKIPVISAIGHETDTTLSDLVADLRASTPSVAAERAVPNINDIFKNIITTRRSLNRIMNEKINLMIEQIKRSSRQLNYLTPNINMFRQQVDEIISRNNRNILGQIQIQQEKINGVESQLSALNPISVLNRGYSIITKNNDNSLVKKINDIELLDDINIHISDGILRGKITEKPS